MTRVIYLHGFSSGPQSSKAQFFAAQFTAAGVAIEIPQLDQHDFPNLTITNQLSVIDKAVANQPAILMGSSLGGYLAAYYAARHPEIEKLILMAPAFQFLRRWKERLSPGDLAGLRHRGFIPMFHYGTNTEQHLNREFFDDASRYEDEPEFSQPALILHGTLDDVVPASISESYASRHPNVELKLYNSGHELTDVTQQMWSEVARFLSVPSPLAAPSNLP